MTEISKPQQENNQSTQTKIQILQNEDQRIDDEYGDDTEGSKKVAQEQGSSGTFNNSRAQDDGYDPDTTIITHNSHETMQENGASSTKQVLAELMAADNNASQHQQMLLQEQNGVGRQSQAASR